MSVAPEIQSYSTAPRETHLVAVLGNPNCGKTTIFNALTGLRQKVGNYPGVTVEKREGVLTSDNSVRLLDLPGTYSLSARSVDEQIARDALLGRLPDTPRPDAVLVVIDATNLERNLYLATQVLELGLPTAIACNVMDLLESEGHKLDLEKLSEALGVPIVPTVALRGEGLDQLRNLVIAVCRENRMPPARSWRMADAVEAEVAQVAGVMRDSGFATPSAADGAAVLYLSDGELARNDSVPPDVRSAVEASLHRLAAQPDLDLAVESTVGRYGWLGPIVDECLKRAETKGDSVSDRLDRILTHKVFGMAAFAGMMALLFYSIFQLATPLMDGIDAGKTWLGAYVGARMSAGPLRDLVLNGIIEGVGNVVIFFPQICILFLFIGLLEDTGYMARAAFLMDRIMSRVGLHGKSFIPLLSSHACAIPGIMATRVIESPKDRLATILVAPLMSCSARLPVYTVLIAACLPGSAMLKAAVLLCMYGLGIVSALTMATIFKKTLLAGPTPAFIMELPPYRLPRVGAVLRVMWDRSKLFLSRAGTVILAITIVLWALMHFPRDAALQSGYAAQREAIVAANPPDAESQLAQVDAAEGAAALEYSLAGRLGRVIEPVLRPLGYDWKIGIGIISSFAAREVFVSTMGIIYSVGEAEDDTSSLQDQLRAARWPDGRRVFTPLVAVGLMVFYVLACQCASTIAIVRRETNSWRWPLFMFGYMTALAYAGALLVYQVGSALGWGT